MASKRKRSRPTRIAKADDVDTESLPGIASYDEETLSRIQRYIEEGSEDTPDCLERKLEQCQTTDNVLFTEHENDFVDSPPMPENSNTVSTKQTKAPSQNEALESVELKFPNVANTHEWHMVQQRLRQADRRKNESHEQRQSRLSLNRQRQAWRRKNETQAERELRLAQGRERASNRRKNETEEERKLRLERHRLQQAERRKRESERERELRLSRVRQVQANRRKNESDEKREVRLTRNRLRQANRRKSESNNTCSLNFAQYQELIPDDIPTESQATCELQFLKTDTIS